MGYKVFYDPTLRWLFIISIIGIVGMFAHYWRKLGMGTAKSDSAASEAVLARRLTQQELRGL
jgi:predicted negative regulator of RcsB-dependent stress response